MTRTLMFSSGLCPQGEFEAGSLERAVASVTFTPPLSPELGIHKTETPAFSQLLSGLVGGEQGKLGAMWMPLSEEFLPVSWNASMVLHKPHY